MYLVAIAWIYVVGMMAVAEALSPLGTVLGAVFTFVLYGLLPLGIVLYILGTPGRRRALRAAEAAADGAAQAAVGSAAPSVVPAVTPSVPPDGGGHAPGDAVASERKEG